MPILPIRPVGAYQQSNYYPQLLWCNHIQTFTYNFKMPLNQIFYLPLLRSTLITFVTMTTKSLIHYKHDHVFRYSKCDWRELALIYDYVHCNLSSRLKHLILHTYRSNTHKFNSTRMHRSFVLCFCNELHAAWRTGDCFLHPTTWRSTITEFHSTLIHRITYNITTNWQQYNECHCVSKIRVLLWAINVTTWFMGK